MPQNVETSAQKTKPKPGESKNNDTDPFDGISDEDIKTYSDLYDEAPPENDDDAVLYHRHFLVVLRSYGSEKDFRS